MSGHAVDDLIRELALTRGPASGLEMATIRAHVAGAEFLSADSLEGHLEKRKIDGQWAVSTTADEYLLDAQSAARSASTVAVYFRRGGSLAALVGSTADIVPTSRLGPRCQPNLLVVYSADRGKVISAYQFSSLAQLALPGDTRWLG